jgi:hypothetical protein
MQKDKLRKNNMEVPATSGTASQTCVQGTRKWMLPVLLIIFGLGIGLAQADDDAGRPVKNLDEANGQIHWPEEMTPKKADSFVHNQIFIKAPASVIWSNLVKAKDWPKWHANSSDVQITDGSELGPKT